MLLGTRVFTWRKGEEKKYKMGTGKGLYDFEFKRFQQKNVLLYSQKALEEKNLNSNKGQLVLGSCTILW